MSVFESVTVIHSQAMSFNDFLFIYFKDFIYLFLEGSKGREKEKHQCVVASHAPPPGHLACNLDMCPHWESNRRHFGSQSALNPLSYTSQGSVTFLKVKQGEERAHYLSARPPSSGPSLRLASGGPRPKHLPALVPLGGAQ